MDEDIEMLAEQRRKRPVYTRLISWAFNQKTEDSIDPESGHRSIDEDEEEPEDECVDHASDVKTDSHFDTAENKDVNKQRKQASSRRKRKWHRRLNRFEYMAPYAHTDNLDLDELQDIKDSLAISRSHVVKPVPTLVELCLRANAGGSTEEEVPALLRTILQRHRDNTSLKSIQLHWLHRMLEYFEHWLNTNCYWMSGTLDEATQSQRYEHRRLRRNIWKEEQYGDSYLADEVSTDVLPYSHYCTHDAPGPCALKALSVMAITILFMLPTNIAHNYGSKAANQHQQAEAEIISRASANAIMRMKHLLTARYPQCVEFFFEHAVPYVWWVRGNMELAEESFLQLVEKQEHVEDKAVYLNEMARLCIQLGQPERALRLYLHAACRLTGKSDHRDSERSTYQLPLQAKMLCAASFDSGLLSRGRCVSASRLWRDALSLTTQDSSYVQSVVVGASNSMMCVHADRHSDLHSNWQEETASHLQLLAATHPQFYLHLSFLEALQGQSQESLQSYQQYIHKFAQHNTPLFHEDLPGLALRLASEEQSGYNVWHLLADAVARCPVRVLSLVWRTQLCQPVFLDQGVASVADFTSTEMQLWLTPEGDLTGDMSMMLPPLEQVRLNAYTGQLVISSPGQGMTFRKTAGPVTDEYGPPRVLQVYSNLADDVSVSLVQSVTDHSQLYHNWTNWKWKGATQLLQQMSQDSKPCHCCLLKYQGPGGQSVTLDLKKLLKTEMRKTVEAEIRLCHNDKQHDDVYMYSESWMKAMLDCLEQYSIQGWDFAFQTISRVVKTKYDCEHPDPPAKPKKNVKKTRSKKPQAFKKHVPEPATKEEPERKKFAHLVPPPTLMSLQVKSYRIVGRCLVLRLSRPGVSSNGTAHSETHLMVVNCSSVESFCNPTIHFQEKRRETDLFTPVASQDATSCRVFMLCQTAAYKDLKHRLLTYSTEGEMVREHVVDVTSPDDPATLLTHAIDSYMYGIHPLRQRLICDQVTQSVCSEKLTSPILEILVLHRLVLLRTDEGLAVRDKDLKQVLWKPCCKFSSTLSTDGQWLSTVTPVTRKVAILAERRLLGSRAEVQGEVVRALVAFSNHLLVLELPVSENMTSEVFIILDIALPGWPTDACFISEQDGIVVTATIFNEEDKYVQENLYQFTYDGRLQAVLPFLGRAPHSFYPVYLGSLPADLSPQWSPEDWRPGWHLYFRDGHGAIVCMHVGVH